MVGRINHRAPWGGGRGGRVRFKELLKLANFTLGPDATPNTEIH